MLPDYLPILEYIGSSSYQSDELALFALLRNELARQDIKLRMVDGSINDGNRQFREKVILNHLATCDLLVVKGPTINATGYLQLGCLTETGYPQGTDRPLFKCPDRSAVKRCGKKMISWLADCSRKTPVRGCVLIGGKSSRMGTPKHLISWGGKTWIERLVAQLSEYVQDVVISGKGEVPTSLGNVKRIKDLPGVFGPMAGIGSLIEHYPLCSWIVVACDMPHITGASIVWLLQQAKPGRAAVIPSNPVSGRIEPLYGWYDFRSGPLFDRLIGEGNMTMSSLGNYPEVYTPDIPAELVAAWANFNRPEELQENLDSKL